MIVPLVAWGGSWREKAKRCIESLPGFRIVVYTDKPEDFPGLETRQVSKGLGKHKINNACYKRAQEEFRCPLVPIAADMVCSSGLFDVLDGHSKAGKRLVVAPVLRSTVVPASCWPRELARVGIQHQHWRQKDLARPTIVFRVHGSGLIANCFHAHPLLFDWPIGPIDSLDGLGVKDIPESQIHIVTDSDEAVVVDVTEEDYDWEESERMSVEELSKTVLPKHRWIFQHDCYIHYEDLPAA